MNEHWQSTTPRTQCADALGYTVTILQVFSFCDDPHWTFWCWVLSLLCRYRPSAKQFPIIVSQDCGHVETAAVIQSYITTRNISHFTHIKVLLLFAVRWVFPNDNCLVTTGIFYLHAHCMLCVCVCIHMCVRTCVCVCVCACMFIYV